MKLMHLSATNARPLPFLKWAGGKRWLTESHGDLFDLKFDRFIEPFLGSGAVFFYLKPKRSLLSDTNRQLIEAYNQVKTNWAAVATKLRIHDRKHSATYYYAIRRSRFRSVVASAAQFIYLNRTCWNGLYRVNLAGKFNVPIGTKQHVLLASDDFEAVSRTLKRADLRACDFEVSLDEAEKGDLIFADPPYTIKHNLNGFVKYNEGLFSWADQIRLRDSIVRAARRGAKIIATNADHQSVRNLYRGVGTITRLSRPSVIGGKHATRGKYGELVIRCNC